MSRGVASPRANGRERVAKEVGHEIFEAFEAGEGVHEGSLLAV